MTAPPYADKYDFLAMRHEDGILEVRLHTEGGPLLWAPAVHRLLPWAFADIAADPSIRVVILTGTGAEFIDRLAWRSENPAVRVDEGVPETAWNRHDRIAGEGDRLLRNLVEIEVPIIAAVNGPARVHAELALLSDIVLAAETAVFGDLAHLSNGVVPGDGVHVVWPLLLGLNRARYFLWAEQQLSADEALRLGLVGEVLPPELLSERAWEHARRLAAKPRLTLRYTRALLTRPLKRALLEELPYGLALEGIGIAAASAERRSAPPTG